MDYQKHYNNLIESRKNRVSFIGYTEKHHIIPKSMGGNNNSSNIVNLTAREHFIAHWLLWRIHKNKQMAYAFFAMQKLSNNGERKIISSRAYQEAKEARSFYIIEFNKKTKSGVPISEKNKQKTSKLFLGIPKTKEHKEKISKALKGKIKSKDHIQKISNALKGYKWSEDRNLNISNKNTGEKNGRSKPIIQKDLKDNIINRFGTSNLAFVYMKNIKKISKHTFFSIIRNKEIFEGFAWIYES